MIHDLSTQKGRNTYMKSLESQSKQKVINTNKYLDRLKQQYKQTQKSVLNYNNNLQDYQAMRLFCLDCELVSFIDIESMEYEVNSELNQSF